MPDPTTALTALDTALGDVVTAALRGDDLRGLPDGAVVGLLAVAASIRRKTDALLIEATAHVADRSGALLRADRLSTRFGCASVPELFQRATLLSSRTAGDFVRAARAVEQQRSLTSGELLPAEFPAMRDAVVDGVAGLEGLVAVIQPLSRVLLAAGRAAFLDADGELAATARGDGAGAAPPASADQLRGYATDLALYLDQDGAEPREARAMRERTLVIGRVRDGLVPIHGHLLPEVAGQLESVCDSIMNPRGDGPDTPTGPVFSDTGDATQHGDADDVTHDGDVRIAEEPPPRTMDEAATVAELPPEVLADADHRTRGQKQHDALATVLSKVAGSGVLPQIGGAAPTLVVSVCADDLESGRGYAHVDRNGEPVSISVARHIACTGAVQRVISDTSGRIIGIEVLDRIFTAAQRRAIHLRDGNCLIPGCHVPADWSEIHHVDEWANGGRTTTDNGVTLCWHHHRTLDTSGWQVRMRRGVPEVKGPYWWDPHTRWRAVTTSPTRRHGRLARRI